MNRRIAVDNSLEEHIQFLEQSGYQIQRIHNLQDTRQLHSFNYDTIVVANAEDIPLDSTSFRPGAPVIEAKNKSPQEIFNILSERHI